MKKILQVTLILTLIATSLISTSNAQAATNSFIVTPLSTDWGFIDDNSVGNGITGFENGPTTAPSGVGSFYIELNSATAGYIMATQKYQGVLLANITALSYSTITNLSPAAISFQINYDPDATTIESSTWYGRLVYEPYINGTVTNNTWQTWNMLDSGNGKWWASPNGNSTVDDTCPQASPCTLTALLASFPNIGIRNDALSAIQFKAGSGANGLQGNVDNFTFETAGTTDVYDFEPVSYVYVDDDWTGTTLGNDPDGAGPATKFGTDSFDLIQNSINAVASNGTIQVFAGSYEEDLSINRPLNLLGPNSTINPNTGTRSAEAIIHPATSNPDPNTSCTIVAYLSTSNITIKGFTFDGDNPNLTSGVMIGSADVDACEILAGYEGMGNIVVENNILKNSTYTGIDFYNYTNTSATSGNYIRYNLIQDIGETTYDWGLGVLIYNNFYADVTHNVFNNVRVGIQTGNFEQVNPGSTGTISNNEINTWRLGIFHNLWYSNASNMPITNNTINAISSSGSTDWDGIVISSFQTAVDTTISNNVITMGSLAQNPAAGYTIWNTPTSAEITISGGSVTGGNYGIWVNNYEGYSSNADNTSISVENLTISGAIDAGVYVLDSPSNTNGSTVSAVIRNTTITNSGKGVHVANADASAEVRNSTIANNTSEGIYNNASTLIVNSSTLASNGVANLSNSSGSVSLTNSVLANSTTIDCTSSNALVLNANNLIETNSGCGTPASTADPLLGALSNNGGLTSTMALSTGSPALEAGNNGTCETTDQRGVTRPQGTTCDMGAYEKLVNASYPTFADVPIPAFGWAHIESIYTAGITGGCSTSPLNYCPDNSVTRAQMAVFLLRGINGSSYIPPAATGTVFTDVPISHPFAAWIEAFSAAGITGGCGGGNYCPDNSVTRSQMAVFLLRAKYGSSYSPPTATGTMFGDVPISNPFAGWIEQLANESITGGCGSGNYCPDSSVTRSQMAIFIQRTFSLPLP